MLLLRLGRYSTVCGFAPNLAKQTGFGDDVLELVFEALEKMFEHDCSAARGDNIPTILI